MALRRLRLVPRTALLMTPTGEQVTTQDGAVGIVPVAVGSDPNRPTDVSWTTAATLPLTSNAAMTTGGFSLTAGTMGTHLGTAAGASYSVATGTGTTLAPGVGPVDSGGRIAWFKVRSLGQTQGRNSVMEVSGFPSTGAKSLFFDFTVQMAADWYGHNSSQCKLLWYAVAQPGTLPWEGILSAWGSGATSPGFAPYFQSTPERTGIQTPRGTLTRGTWKRCQVLVVAESSVGANDGIVKWWMDGTLLNTITDMDFGGIGFKQPQLQVYWGGNSTLTAPNDLYVFMDYVKISYSTSRSAG